MIAATIVRSAALTIALTILACGSPHAAASGDYSSVKKGYQKSLAARQRPNIPEDAALLAADSTAILDLEARLRPIIGELQLNGRVVPTRINLSTLLSGYEESGVLDGLLYRSADSATRIVVTTPALLIAWLDELYSDKSQLPRDATDALTRPETYTTALETDAAVSRYAGIPADSGAPGVVSAMLVGRAQDIGPQTPNEVLVGVIRGGRVFIVDTPARVSIAPMATCLDLWKRGTNDEADAAFHRCFEERAPATPEFTQLGAQVREILASLPPR